MNITRPDGDQGTTTNPAMHIYAVSADAMWDRGMGSRPAGVGAGQARESARRALPEMTGPACNVRYRDSAARLALSKGKAILLAAPSPAVGNSNPASGPLSATVRWAFEAAESGWGAGACPLLL